LGGGAGKGACHEATRDQKSIQTCHDKHLRKEREMSDTSSEIRVPRAVKHQMLAGYIWKKMTRSAAVTTRETGLLHKRKSFVLSEQHGTGSFT
jgi:hypothetical protein